jgi:hypothetical protein
VGYGPFDDYDRGSKNQKGTLPTRYGTREQLERRVAMLRANGLDVYVDWVENRRQGMTAAITSGTWTPRATPVPDASRRARMTFTRMWPKTRMYPSVTART